MAKITHSELAPAEKVVYTLANEQFELTAKGSYESDDPIVLSNAEVHPWLSVEYPEVAPDEIADDDVRPVGTAIEAGQDQKEVLFADETPVTLAADKKAPDFIDDEGEPAEAPPVIVDDEPEYDKEIS